MEGKKSLVEQYRAFITNSTEGIWRFEAGQPVPIDLPMAEQIDAFYTRAYLAECNDICAQMHGFGNGARLVGTLLANFLPRDIPANVAFLSAFVASGYRLTGFESTAQDRDGTTRYFVNSLIGSVENGVLVRAWGTQRDITEQRRLERELREREAEQARQIARQEETLQDAEDRFRLLVENAPDYAIFLLDRAGNIATWNAGAERFQGYRAEEVIGSHISRFYTPEDIAQRQPWVELETATRLGRYEEEGWRLRKDGTRFWATEVITALHDAQGELRGFGMVTRDITERREREQERVAARLLQQQRQFLKDVLSSVTQGKLLLCDSPRDLPVPLDTVAEGDGVDGGEIVLTSAMLRVLRRLVVTTAMVCRIEEDRRYDLLSGVSETAMNAVVHAGGGVARVYSDPLAGKVQVWVVDHGKGIDLSSIPRATLERGYSSAGTLGHGFWLMLQTCDRIYLLTGTEGTTVVIEQNRHAPSPAWLRGL